VPPPLPHPGAAPHAATEPGQPHGHTWTHRHRCMDT